MRRYFSFILSFELLFVLFLNAGEFNQISFLKPITSQIHLSGISLALTCMTGSIVFIRNKTRINRDALIYFFIFLVLCSYLSISYLQVYGNPKADRKFVEFYAIIFFTVIFGTFLINNPDRANRFIASILLFGTILSLVIILKTVFGEIAPRGAKGAFSEGYHRLGRSSGSAIVISAILFSKTRTKWEIIVLSSILCTNLAGLILSANRAPFVTLPFTFFLLFTILAFGKKQGSDAGIKKKYILISIGLLSIFGAVLVSHSDRAKFIIDRFKSESFLRSNRLNLYKKSFEIFSDNPILGIGFGGFSKSTGIESKRHPHNMYIEVLLELGLIGFFLYNIFIFWWILYLRPLKYTQQKSTQFFLIALFIFTISNSMISGDLTDNRIFIAITTILTTTSIYIKKQEAFFHN